MFLATLALLTTSLAVQTEHVHGILIHREFEICTRLEADDGRIFVVQDDGGFGSGERVYVEGTVPSGSAGLCTEIVYPLLDVASIRAGFSGQGLLVRRGGRALLVTRDMHVYALRNPGTVPTRTRVHVRGWLNTATTPPTLENDAIGAAVSGFGRFVGVNALDRRVQGLDGRAYVLDEVSARFLRSGDLLWFEGIRGAETADGTEVLEAVGRFAFVGTGPVVLAGGVHALDCREVVLQPPFVARGLERFAPGELVFVLGRAPEDWEPGEARDRSLIRRARVAPGYSSTGFFVGDLFLGDDGSIVSAEYQGPALPGGYGYLYGRLDRTDPASPVVRDDLVLQGFDGLGTLEIGFECAPLLIPAVLFVENREGIPIHHQVRARGGIRIEVAPCPFPALVGASLTDLGDGGEEQF